MTSIFETANHVMMNSSCAMNCCDKKKKCCKKYKKKGKTNCKRCPKL